MRFEMEFTATMDNETFRQLVQSMIDELTEKIDEKNHTIDTLKDEVYALQTKRSEFVEQLHKLGK